jgi:predicted RNA-binding protein associated with RNAse of E/G family
MQVNKLNPAGEVVWRYSGRLLRRDPHVLTLEAFFDIGEAPVGDVVLQRGDRFVEAYFDSRWYNAFGIFGRENGMLKGWYYNLSRPAELGSDTVSWVDLALDLWIWPDGRRTILDREEFAALRMSDSERQQALAGLADLERRLDVIRPPP